jgi:ribosomal protein S18 acetylase RimI-like enzyme
VTVREPAPGDAAAVAELLNAQSLEVAGVADVSTEAIRSWFQLPDLAMLVADGSRGLDAYADFHAGEGTDWAWIDARERPGRPGAVLPLVERFEARAARLGRSAVRTMIAAGDEGGRGRLEQRGYAPIRYSFRMLVELEDEPPAPSFPDGIGVRVMRPGEERAVYEAAMDSFADHWGFHPDPFDSWRRWNLERDGSRPDLWWLALDGDDIAGICLDRFADDGDPAHGYVHILGVRRAWRRRGLGEALLRHSFRDFWQRGCRRVSLDVDGENTTGAVRLYERVGMQVVRRMDTYEKRLT